MCFILTIKNDAIYRSIYEKKDTYVSYMKTLLRKVTSFDNLLRINKIRGLGMKRKYADTSLGQIHYLTEGDGDPLLLLHQTALSSDEYTSVIPLLAKKCRVIAPDVMGYGNSDSPVEPFMAEDHALSFIQFLDELGIQSVNVFGHHSGAGFAVALAVTFPERVDKLILSGCPNLTPEMRHEWFEKPAHRPMEIRADGSHLQEWWNHHRERFSYLEPEGIQRMLSEFLKADLGRNAHAAFFPIYHFQLESKLPLIKCPTLLVTSPEDFFHFRHEATKDRIANCHSYILNGTHDHPAYEDPAELTRAILSFL